MEFLCNNKKRHQQNHMHLHIYLFLSICGNGKLQTMQ